MNARDIGWIALPPSYRSYLFYWSYSPNSLWRTMNKIANFEDEINRRTTQLRK